MMPGYSEFSRSLRGLIASNKPRLSIGRVPQYCSGKPYYEKSKINKIEIRAARGASGVLFSLCFLNLSRAHKRPVKALNYS